jgi:Ran GTPase-activating protein (RanGAP) involved in mRNA processing and transport
LSIDLEDVKASPEILAVACTLSPSVTSLSLKNTCLTANGGNTVALRRLCGVLRGGHTPQLATLDLARNQLGPADLERLSAALQDIRSLTSLDLSNNALCGILLKDVDDGGLSSNYTAKGITAMAEALHANCSLTKLS